MLSGVKGQIKWGYHCAAEVNRYTVTCSKPDRKWALRATVTQADDMKLSQAPLVFVAPHQGGEWRWPIESLERTGNTVAAALGEPLK